MGRVAARRAVGRQPTTLAVLLREREGRLAATTDADMLNQDGVSESCYGATQFTLTCFATLFGEPVTNPVVALLIWVDP